MAPIDRADLSVRDVMRLLNRSRSFVYENAAQLGAYRSGGRGLRFTAAGIEAWRQRNRLAPALPTPITAAPRRPRIADLYPPGTINKVTGAPF